VEEGSQSSEKIQEAVRIASFDWKRRFAANERKHLCIGACLNLRSKLAAIACYRKLEFHPIVAEYLQYTSDFAVEFPIQKAMESGGKHLRARPRAAYWRL
jgi:hypothetical protein